MTGTDGNPSLEALLEHSAWLRALAARLVTGQHEADDLVQEVWRTTLAARPSDVRAPRAWLAGALRNVLRMRSRTDGRRAERERAVARADELPSTDRLVAEQEIRRRLIALVDTLPEGEREVVLLRFWRDLPPRDVARELGIPVNTVRSRTQRALERLRGRLDAEHGGDRRAWCLALVPLLDLRSLRAAGGAGGVVGLFGLGGAGRALLAAMVVVALGAVSLVVWALLEDGELDAPDFSSTLPADLLFERFDARPADVAEADPGPGTSQRRQVEREAIPDAVHGRVVDIRGRPIEGALVHREQRWIYELAQRKHPEVRELWAATSGADGEFRFADGAFAGIAVGERARIGEVTHESYVAERGYTDFARGDAPVELTMRRLVAATLEIEVVDVAGSGVVPRFEVDLSAGWGQRSNPGSNVVLAGDPGLRSRHAIDRADPDQHGRNGSLRTDVRLVEGVDNVLLVQVAGGGTFRETLEVPAADGAVIRRRYEVDLGASTKVVGNRVVSGRVVDDVTGEPVAGAELLAVAADTAEIGGASARRPTAQTSVAGRFALGHDPALRLQRLAVEHPDYLPTSTSVPATGDTEIEIRLEPLARLELTVVDDAGRPCPDTHALVLSGSSGRPDLRERRVTDANGTIVLERLPPRTGITVYFVPDAWSADEQAFDSRSIELSPGAVDKIEHRLRMPGRVVVTGRVVGSPSVDLVPVFVPLDEDRGWIQSQGRGAGAYLAGRMARGRYLPLLVPADDREADAGPFAFGSVVEISGAARQSVDIVFPTGVVTGRVLGRADDREGVRVVAKPRLAKTSLATRQMFSSGRIAEYLGHPVEEGGAFAIRHLADGTYDVQLRRGAEVLAERMVTVVGGAGDVGDWLLD
jgi:RNA polymerase sigma-70 factor (ECF subfamily)